MLILIFNAFRRGVENNKIAQDTEEKESERDLRKWIKRLYQKQWILFLSILQRHLKKFYSIPTRGMCVFGNIVGFESAVSGKKFNWSCPAMLGDPSSSKASGRAPELGVESGPLLRYYEFIIISCCWWVNIYWTITTEKSLESTILIYKKEKLFFLLSLPVSSKETFV